MKKATSLQSSLSCENESNHINKFDLNNTLTLQYGQGLRTLTSVLHARYSVFFCALKPVFCIGRGGAVQCKSGLSVKAARRSSTVLNTPIALRSNQLKKILGGHHHA